jgi:hypothetical protein
MTEPAVPGQSPAASRKSPAVRMTAAILLIIAIGGSLWVPIYARPTPKLGGVPFFYWFQLVWVPVAAVLCWICYELLKTRPAPDADPGNGEGAAR